jgi:hypothetical protein
MVHAVNLMSMLAAMLLKLSLLLLYQRIFNIDRHTRYAICAATALVTLYYGTAAVLLLSLCMPRRVRDGSGGRNGRESYLAAQQRCGQHQMRLIAASSAFRAASDVLLLLLLPLPLVWQLHLPLRRKVGLTALFITGLGYVASPANLSPISPLFVLRSMPQDIYITLLPLGLCCVFIVSRSHFCFCFYHRSHQ